MFYISKGLERQRLIGLAETGFNHAYSISKASAPCVGARRDDFIRGICFHGSLGHNPGRIQLDGEGF